MACNDASHDATTTSSMAPQGKMFKPSATSLHLLCPPHQYTTRGIEISSQKVSKSRKLWYFKTRVRALDRTSFHDPFTSEYRNLVRTPFGKINSFHGDLCTQKCNEIVRVYCNRHVCDMLACVSVQ